MSDVCRCGYTKEQHGIAPCHYFRFDHAESSDLDTLKSAVRELRAEVNCRIEHGAESGGHLEYVQRKLDAIMKGVGG